MRPMNFLTDALVFNPQKEQLPPGFTPLAALPLVIMVGLTGVGKSTVLDQLHLPFTLLPNRRELTDAIIITSLQLDDDQPPQPVTDRLKRFEYTARYREKFEGGMAYALSQLSARLARPDDIIIFDGLRGLDEVKHATRYLPLARFVVLDAPDMVRLNRLLFRGDAFDQISLPNAAAGQDFVAALMSINNIDAVFPDEELHQIAHFARANGRTTDDVVKKATIIVEERRNYDSRAARVHLARALPPKQLLVVDTSQQPAGDIAAQVNQWLTQSR